MLELNVTGFVLSTDCEGVIAFGWQGQEAIERAWGKAIAAYTEYPFVTKENVWEVIDYIESFGAWDDLDTWPVEHLNAVLLQEISSLVNEMPDPDVDQAAHDAWQESSGGRLFINNDEEYYYYVGS